MMKEKQLEQSVKILQEVVDIATGAGLFKKVSDAALVSQAMTLIKNELAPNLDAVEEETAKPVKKSK